MGKTHSLLPISFILIAAWAGLHHAAEALYLYWTIGWFDNFMHFLGGFSLGLFALWALRRSGRGASRLGSLAASAAAVAAVAVGWELMEYIGDIRHTGGYLADTLSDLAFGIMGAVAAGIVGSRKNISNTRHG